MSVQKLVWASAFVLAVTGGAHAQLRERVIEAVGTARAAPDTWQVMMKMEYDAGLARDAIAGGEKQLQEFLAAADALKVPGLRWRVSNNVLTPANEGPGITYSRNIVFTLARAVAAPDPLIAKLEDLGARHHSHCVTCIGSG